LCFYVLACKIICIVWFLFAFLVLAINILVTVIVIGLDVQLLMSMIYFL